MMESDIAIKIDNLSKYYKLYEDPKYRLKEALSLSKKSFHKKYYAINHLDLSIEKGEIVGIVGKNGSGKSTLLKLITGVLSPDGGSINVNGKISALLELGSGFNPEFTGLQNIFFYGTVLGLTKQQMSEKLDDIVAFADIGDFMNQPLKTYSSGMKSRLAFAVAIHIEPEILILDEVLSVGDIHFKRKSYAKMQEFFESGKTIIYVSHSSSEVNRLCTRAIFLHEGKVLMDGDPKEVTKYYEKLLFAKDENKEKIINEAKKSKSIDSNKNKEKEKNNNNEIKKEKNIESFYIPDMESKNKMIYDDTYLHIDNIYIETLEKKRVNVLTTNNRYRLCYTLTFFESFYSVDFGMQIMSEKGVLIAGAKEPESVDFKRGDKVEICWEFDCLMHAGVYYINIGVNHPVDGKREYINRVIDAYMFKVQALENNTNGLVYLKQSEPTLQYIKA